MSKVSSTERAVPISGRRTSRHPARRLVGDFLRNVQSKSGGGRGAKRGAGRCFGGAEKGAFDGPADSP
ncbi:hypothetical protein DP49_5232 [Burkholderia pseudomallei]|nr:hypothetical protein DP49_5232 [Burkholderia pseudomallei]